MKKWEPWIREESIGFMDFPRNFHGFSTDYPRIFDGSHNKLNLNIHLSGTRNKPFTCWFDTSYMKDLLNYYIIPMFFLMSFIIFVIYISIGCLICKRNQGNDNQNIPAANRQLSTSMSTATKLREIQCTSEEGKKLSSSSSHGYSRGTSVMSTLSAQFWSLEAKNVRVLATCMFAYFLLYLPQILTTIFEVANVYKYIAVVLIVANGMANPVIYWGHPNFNEAYRQILNVSY